MPSLAGIRATAYTLFRAPVDPFIVLGIRLQAKILTLLWPKPLYRPIGPNNLRLLDVHPPLTTRSDELLRCTLHHVSLDYSPEYKAWETQADPGLRLYKKTKAWYAHRKTQKDAGIPCPWRYTWGDYIALSYCWGNGARSHEIILNGRIVAVTETLESALRSVRGGWGSLRLWADALSINQDDIAERGREVRRMRGIYGDTVGLFVHLGPEADGSTEALHMMERIAKHMRDGTDIARYALELSTAVNNNEPVPDRDGLIAIFKLFCRQYWSRMWIIQELAMGDDQVVVGCGNEGLDFTEIRQVLKFFVLNQESFNNIIPKDVYTEHYSTYAATIQIMWSIGRLREIALEPADRSFTFSELCHPLLQLSMYANATDMRDKVYGAMSLLPASLASRVDKGEDNYTISPTQVFHDFTRAIIEITKDLDVVFTGNYRQKALSKLDLPTWSPDWTLSVGRATGNGSSQQWFFGEDVRYESFDKHHNLPSTWITDPSRSDTGRVAQIDFLSEGKLLCCQGFPVATISGVCPEIESLLRSSSEPDIVLSQEGIKHPYGDEEETSNALVRTLLMDASGKISENSILLKIPYFGDIINEDGSPDFAAEGNQILDEMMKNGWDSRFFAGGLHTFYMFRRYISQFVVGTRPFKDYFAKTAVPCPPDASPLEFGIVVSNLVGRRLITTTSGHIGLAPITAVSRDIIYVIVGCSMPVILRPDPTGKYFEVVGECFVDGFMKGEAMEELDDGRHKLQEIVLC